MELTLDQALREGVLAHKQGRLKEAEGLYRTILNAQPCHPDANHNLGVLVVSIGKPLDAIPLFKQALEGNPEIEQFWLSYVDLLIKLEYVDEVERVLARARQMGVSLERLSVLYQRFEQASDKGNERGRQNLSLSGQRRRLAKSKKSKERRVHAAASALGPSQDQISLLLAHYEANRFAQAEELAFFLQQQYPNHPFAWKVLGVIYKQTGRLLESLAPMQRSVLLSAKDAEAHSNLGITLKELGRLGEAEASYRQAITLKPDFAEAHSNLGNLLQELGRLDESELCLGQAIALKPDYAQAHYNLGVTLRELARLNEAEASFTHAATLKPDYAEAHYNLGATRQELGKLDEAEESYTQAVAIKPNYAEAHYNLGITRKELGRLEEAEASSRRTITLKPDYAEAHYNLGITLQELAKLDEAEASYRQAIALKPGYAEAHGNLGITCQELGRLDEAETNYRRAIALKPDYFEAYNNLGNVLRELRDLDGAEASYRKAIALKPDYPEASSNLGVTLQELGRLEEAEESYRQAIAVKPDYAEAYRNLAATKKFSPQDEQICQMEALYRDPTISEYHRCHICFALAKAFEDLKDFHTAFRFYQEGNALRKKQLGYDKAQDRILFGRLKECYPRMAAGLSGLEAGATECAPIFIIGMPRSGTTLIEQVISSHPLVAGAGELPFVPQFGGSLAVSQAAVDGAKLNIFREQYLSALWQRSEGKAIVTDKMPQNFRFLGLIALALPEAKIVHVKRDPAAVCWANYTQYFVKTSIGYCYSLDEILHYYELYQDIMEFWHQVLPGRIYDIEYERFTEQQREETHKLIDHLGLYWDDACLSPQDNKRGVATASNVQVRTKVYEGSSGRWKCYRPYLAGILDHLGVRHH